MQEAVVPVLPFTAAGLAAVLFVGLQVSPRTRPARPLRAPLSPVGRPTAAAAVGLLLVALAAGARLLGDSELDNPVSPLVVGLGLPLLLLGPLLVSLLVPLVRALRVPGRRTAEPDAPAARAGADGPGDVRPAVPLALLLASLLALAPAPARPQLLGPALAAYAVLLAAAALAGGLRLAARADVLGLLGRWAALGPRLTSWSPPRGATAVLVLLLGGAWAERAARTTAFVQQLPGTADRAGLLAAAVAVAGLLTVPLRRHGAAAVLLPVAVAAVVAGGLRRTLISAQLLRDTVVGDAPVVPDPLGVAGGQLLALGLAVALGGAAAAVLARRAAPGPDRLSGLTAVVALTGVTAVLVLQP